MPADRTTTSFEIAKLNGLPLSSHGPSHPASLERGKACKVCRSRKVRCDSVRPYCGACKRSALAHGSSPSACTYDDNGSKPRLRKKKSDQSLGKIADLQAKVAHLESLIDGRSGMNNNTMSMDYQPLPPIASTSTYNPTFNPLPPNPNSNSNHLNPLLSQSQSSSFYSPSNSTTNEFNSPSGTSSTTSHQAGSMNHNNNRKDKEREKDQHQYALPAPWESTFEKTLPNPTLVPKGEPDALLEIFFPGWPASLPSPSITNRLIEVYFSKSHSASGMLNQQKIQSSILLSPTHIDFPHIALIHSMLAIASRMVNPDLFFTLPEDKYWARFNSEESVEDYHSSEAKRGIDEAIPQGMKLFQVAQAAILLTFHSYTCARFVEVWLMSGLAIRMCTPLGLNHLRALSSTTERNGGEDKKSLNVLPNKSTLLQPTFDEEELYERSITFWFAIVGDRFSSASTGWALGLDEADITSLLPSPPGAFLLDSDAHLSPLSIKNPGLLLAHPPHLVLSLQLYFKAVLLMGRVVSFVQRAPSPIGMSMNVPKPSPNQSTLHTDLRNSAEFQKLDSDTLSFRLSIPKELQSIESYSNDSKMCLVHALPHASTILLHENFVLVPTTTLGGREGEDESFRKCLGSARAILEAIYRLWSSSFELSLLIPYIAFTWSVAGRTLVRELAMKQFRKDFIGQENLVNDVVTIMNAMKALKNPLGESLAAALQILLSNPEVTLPYSDEEVEDIIPTFIGNQFDNTSTTTSSQQGSNSNSPFNNNNNNISNPYRNESNPISTSTSTNNNNNNFISINTTTTDINTNLKLPGGVSAGILESHIDFNTLFGGMGTFNMSFTPTEPTGNRFGLGTERFKEMSEPRLGGEWEER